MSHLNQNVPTQLKINMGQQGNLQPLMRVSKFVLRVKIPQVGHFLWTQV